MDDPKWRTPPRRLGELEPLEVFERNSVTILIAIAAAVLFLAGYVYGVDWLVGHL